MNLGGLVLSGKRFAVPTRRTFKDTGFSGRRTAAQDRSLLLV